MTKQKDDNNLVLELSCNVCLNRCFLSSTKREINNTYVGCEGVAADEEFALREILGITSGGCYYKKDLEDAVSRLFDTGWYRHVCMRFVAQPGGTLTLTVVTEDASYSGISSFQFINVRPESHGIHYNFAQKREEGGVLCHKIPFSARSLLPKSIQTEISGMLQTTGKVPQTTLRFIQESIENWYHSRGYVYAKVTNFRNSNGGALQCHVAEGNITQLSVLCEDEFGQCMQCHTNTDVIVGKLPLAVICSANSRFGYILLLCEIKLIFHVATLD